MKFRNILFAFSLMLILTSSSEPIANESNLIKEEVIVNSCSIDDSDEQCVPSWRWVGDNWCNIMVRVDNPCSRTVYYYIILNNCYGSNCIRCYYVNPGSYFVQPINWCAGGTFYWGSC
ncbi:MAG: hypothetical protein AAGI07_18725 [Bacteroidota bacterium]